MSFIFDAARDTAFAARSLYEAAEDTIRPRLRLGVTGLSRSGKTVFTTAMIHHLMSNARLPVLTAAAEGRISRVRLAPQPDETVPRFPYEAHLAAIMAPDRQWPASTTQISELRLVIDYERRTGWRKGPSSLTLDIVDYPGEWLLDLALIDTSFADWSREAIAASEAPARRNLASQWRADLDTIDTTGPADEARLSRNAGLFRAYLVAARESPETVATMPPGRFLMPGDLDGSPALTFTPLRLAADHKDFAPDTMGALMARRFDAYRNQVARRFFSEHFARLDRQIVLVDVLAALDSGPRALAELEQALDGVLMAFRAGRNTLISSLFAPRIDKVLFAATKADHLHHSQHDRLEDILRMLVGRAMRRVTGAGGETRTAAIAAIRATRETGIKDGGRQLDAIIGVPVAGERVGDDTFDGSSEAAIYPGSLPTDPSRIFEGAIEEGSLRFPRFRPPVLTPDAAGRTPPLPHIRLDRALEFLIGDRLS